MTDILTKTLDKHYSGKWDSFSCPTGTMADFENIEWVGDAPSKSDFQTQYDAEEQAHNNTQYQRDRQYPEITEQLDLIYWDKKNGTKKWEEAIDKVKADNPKLK